ncbi:glycosyltransferase [Dyella solisilvae]|uniref:Glycosyltransferase n=1 Tax=Dyella solisilvae TaxID=1920168 RepID=A0A370K3U8_9GAMM|nr:bacteriohopanetetrol glucosamine biosynthesis glycosyltransferase HpnI [Dyella solisilvae]RDI97335.1 glycosyltransferase [Dyella solisilvae]
MHTPHYAALTHVLPWLGIPLGLCAIAYAYLSLWACVVHARTIKHPQVDVNDWASQPVSVLKPLHGMEPDLYENLRSFCEQAYAIYELLCGVRESDDPAVAVVKRLQQEFPQRTITLVVDSQVHGANPKVSNLINLLAHANHDWLVLADSDIRVPSDYLGRVCVPLQDEGIGIVTCLYHGLATEQPIARMGRLFIDDWFAPSVRLAHAFGSTHFAFGSTIAMRRETLRRMGGFEALRDTLADDFWLGELSRRLGLRTVLSDVEVGTTISERDLGSLWRRELRWLRTIRAISPMGFFFSFICFTWPLLLLVCVLEPTEIGLLAVLCGGVARVLRYVVSWRDTARSSPWRDIWLTPFRDVLLLVEWAGALVHWRVHWRDHVLHARDHTPSRYS